MWVYIRFLDVVIYPPREDIDIIVESDNNMNIGDILGISIFAIIFIVIALLLIRKIRKDA